MLKYVGIYYISIPPAGPRLKFTKLKIYKCKKFTIDTTEIPTASGLCGSVAKRKFTKSEKRIGLGSRRGASLSSIVYTNYHKQNYSNWNYPRNYLILLLQWQYWSNNKWISWIKCQFAIIQILLCFIHINHWI